MLENIATGYFHSGHVIKPYIYTGPHTFAEGSRRNRVTGQKQWEVQPLTPQQLAEKVDAALMPELFLKELAGMRGNLAIMNVQDNFKVWARKHPYNGNAPLQSGWNSSNYSTHFEIMSSASKSGCNSLNYSTHFEIMSTGAHSEWNS